MTNSISADDMHTWLAKSAPGATMCYHRGYLPTDRRPHFSYIKPSKDMLRINRCAAEMLALSDAGLVTLAQRRNGEFSYDYLAIALSNGAPAWERARRKKWDLTRSNREHSFNRFSGLARYAS